MVTEGRDLHSRALLTGPSGRSLKRRGWLLLRVQALGVDGVDGQVGGLVPERAVGDRIDLALLQAVAPP